MLPRMNSSVKFFEPTVIGGVDAAPLTGWMVVPLELEDDEPVELVLLLSLLLLPQAASTNTAASARSAAARGRVVMGNFLLVVDDCLSPAGVTARCRPAKRASKARASSATRIAPPRRPESP